MVKKWLQGFQKRNYGCHLAILITVKQGECIGKTLHSKSRALHLGIYPQNYRKKNKVLEHIHVWSSHQKPLKSFGQTLTLDSFNMATYAQNALQREWGNFPFAN